MFAQLRRRTRAALVVAGTLVLAACAALPSSGPVEQGVEGAPEPDGLVFLAADPRPGDDPEQIVRGFLDAATAGVSERFETAQKYLTGAARSMWRPGGSVTIYSGSTPPTVHEASPGEVEVTVSVAATVDDSGVYTEEAPGVETTVEFSLVRGEHDEWRINALDDGVLMSAVNFGTQYRRVALYFVSPDTQFFVPDSRWMPQRNSATSAVQGLLRGPVPWLASGVITALPSGTTAEPVTVTEGVAEVNLSDEVLAASRADRSILLAQMQQTLGQLPQVRRVEVKASQVDLDVDVHPINPTVDPGVEQSPVGIADGTLVGVSGGQVAPLTDAVPLAPDQYHDLAMPYGDGPLVAVSDDTTLTTVPMAEEEAVELLTVSGGIVAPSYDRFTFVWTGATSNDGRLIAVNPVTGDRVDVVADAFEGSKLRALRVSRDGARIAVVTMADGAASVRVAAIVRDERGTPQELGPMQVVGRSLTAATTVVWIDDQDLGVLGVSDGSSPTVHVVPLGGPSAALPSVPGAVSLAAGRGEHELWVGTVEGDLYARSGNGWRKVGHDVTIADPTLPG